MCEKTSPQYISESEMPNEQIKKVVNHVGVAQPLSAFLKSYPHYMAFPSFCDVSDQVWTGVRHSCRSLPPLCWTNNNIWGWYSGELLHTKPLLKAMLSHVQFMTGPDQTCHASSVNRPVYTEEGTTASPRTEPPVWGGGRGGSPLVSWDYLIY